MHAANAPPPTWTSARSRSTPASASSQPIVRPPSRHSAFSGPCTLNGTAPAATASRNRSTAGSPGGSRGAPLARVDRRPEALQRRRAPTADAHVGTNTSIGQYARRASVAAAIAAFPHEAMASGRRGPSRQAQRLGRDEVQQDRDEVTALVAAADVAGLVLDPDVAADGVGHRVGAGERRDREPVGQLAREGDARRLGHPVRPGERPPRQPRPVGDERVGVVQRRRVGAHDVRVQHVVAVVGGRPRARERVGRGDVDVRAADGAAPADDHEPTRALNSVIISSHTPT